MFREPWFQILDVVEKRGRSIADICAEASRDLGVPLPVLRGGARKKRLGRLRRQVYVRIVTERPDVSSTQIGRYFNREASAIRKAIIKEQASQ